MNVLIFISLLVIFLSYLESKGVLKNGMLIGFIVLTAIMSIRFEYGNDYVSYQMKYLYNNNFIFSIKSLFDGTIEEPFWFLLNRLFIFFGFQSLVFFLTMINSIAYYNLIHKILPKQMWMLGLFIYFFTSAYFPLQLSMMRQALSMSLVIIAFLYVIEKRIILSSFFLILASGIHTSALLSLPLISLCYFDMTKYKNVLFISFICLFICFYVAKDNISSLMSYLLHSISAFERYEDKYLLGTKYDASEAKSLFGSFLYLFPVATSLIYLRRCDDEKYLKISVLYIFGSFIYLTDQIVPMVARISWYFSIFSIIALPVAFLNIKTRFIKYGLVLLFIMVTVREYYGFFYALNWKNAFLEFKTIFS